MRPALAVLLFSFFLLGGAADTKLNNQWTGLWASWPTSGEGLVMGWTKQFSTEKGCREWVVAHRVASTEIYTNVNTTTGACWK